MYNNNNEFRSMKRARSPDSSFDTGQSFRGGHHPFRGGYQNQHHHNSHHPFKRHRNEHGTYQPPQTIEEKIAKLGETGSRNADIGVLAKDIDIEISNKNNDDEKIKNITSHICKCIVSFPTRIATYSTLIGLISVKHYNVSCQIINILQASYPVYLKSQKWSEALTIMHVLASLVNCKVIQPAALLSQFETFLDVSNELNTPQIRSDYFVYTVMSSLPYVAQELAIPSDPPNNFESILSRIESYLNSRSKDHLNHARVWQSNDSTVQMDYLDSLWVQTKNFRANNWVETFLHRPYNDKEYKDIMASSLIPQASPVMQVPQHCPSFIYPSPKIVFRVYEDDVVEGNKSIPGSDKIERFCIENHIRNIIEEIPTDARICGRHLTHMYRSDHLPMKHLLTETILGELFSLPKTRHEIIFYHVLLLEFTKLFQPSKDTEHAKTNYDVILNEAVKVLYQNLETMNVTCFTRFIEWFSFHLNNIEFIYPWITWQDAEMDKEKTSAKALFVHEILERCIRFSFHKKISTMVQVSLPNLIPPEVAISYNPVFKVDPKADDLADTVRKLITGKADGKTICEALNIIIDGIELGEEFTLKEEEHHDQLLKIDIFTSVILDLASRSLTHMSSAIGKYKNVFKALISVQNGQIQLLQSMHSCLITHPQLQIILVDKLLKAELVDVSEVCNWLFSEPMRANHLRSYPWDILNNTVARQKQIITKLEREFRESFDVVNPPAEAKQDEKKTDGSKTPEHPEDQNGDKSESKEENDDMEGEANKDTEMSAESQSQIADHHRAKLQDQLDDASKHLYQLLSQVLTMFLHNVTDHMKACESNGIDHKDTWYKWFTGRMQQFYYNHYDTIQSRDDLVRIIMKTLNYK